MVTASIAEKRVTGPTNAQIESVRMIMVREEEVRYASIAEKRAIWQKIVGLRIPTNQEDLKILGKTEKQRH